MSLKAILWKRTQQKRDGFERRFYPEIRLMLNREFRKLADKIDVTNYGSDGVLSHMSKNPIEKEFLKLYTTVGVFFAKDTYKRLKSEFTQIEHKEEDIEDTWYREMESYVKVRCGNKIVSIAQQNKELAKKIIREIIKMSTDEGWGADQVAREIKKALLTEGIEMNKWRALRIARTEIVSASNQGSHTGAKKLNKEYPMQKLWISTYDSRTRDTHLVMESQNPKDMDEAFIVGGVWPAEVPGDPDLPPEEVINCRCAISYAIKGI
jgi:hypothetical protein